jgi:hypothetical protein
MLAANELLFTVVGRMDLFQETAGERIEPVGSGSAGRGRRSGLFGTASEQPAPKLLHWPRQKVARHERGRAEPQQEGGSALQEEKNESLAHNFHGQPIRNGSCRNRGSGGNCRPYYL